MQKLDEEKMIVCWCHVCDKQIEFENIESFPKNNLQIAKCHDETESWNFSELVKHRYDPKMQRVTFFKPLIEISEIENVQKNQDE